MHEETQQQKKQQTDALGLSLAGHPCRQLPYRRSFAHGAGWQLFHLSPFHISREGHHVSTILSLFAQRALNTYILRSTYIHSSGQLCRATAVPYMHSMLDDLSHGKCTQRKEKLHIPTKLKLRVGGCPGGQLRAGDHDEDLACGQAPSGTFNGHLYHADSITRGRNGYQISGLTVQTFGVLAVFELDGVDR